MLLSLRPLVTVLLLFITVAPLGAELKITSRVEVRKITEPKARFRLFHLRPSLAITPGRVEITTSVAGGRVRVDGMGPLLGLDRDAFLITRSDGATVVLQPASRTYFILTNTDVGMVATTMGTTVKTSRKGASDVILSQRTERVIHEIQLLDLTSRTSAGPPQVDHEGPTHDPYGQRTATSLTAEERQLEARRSSYRSRESPDQDVMKIESWESKAFAQAATVAAHAGASPAAICSAGFLVLTSGAGFPLRQVLTYPTGGYRMEIRVTSVIPESFTESIFEVPAGFREVPPPPPVVFK